MPRGKQTAFGHGGRRPGAGPKPQAGVPRQAGLHLRLTDAERRELEAAAGAEPVSAWARDVLLRAARRGRRRT